MWQPTWIWMFILIFLSLNSEPELLNLEDIRFVWSGWQTGYWSLWRNETALHSPQSELDQGFLELQIVNDKSSATKNLWRECGGFSFYVVQLMAPSTLMTVSVLCSVYFLSQFSSLGWPNPTHIKDFCEKKAPKLPDFWGISFISSNADNRFQQVVKI